MGQSYWIWYPGDMELYYGMKQNFSRVERGFGWPAFWKSEGFRNRVALGICGSGVPGADIPENVYNHGILFEAAG